MNGIKKKKKEKNKKNERKKTIDHSKISLNCNSIAKKKIV